MQIGTFLATGLLTTAALGYASPRVFPRGKASSPGCGQPPLVQPGNWQDGKTPEGREYRIWVPNNYDQQIPAPVILSYHGASSNINKRIKEDRLSDTKFNKDHIVVYLQGVRREPDNPKSTMWQGAPGAPADDISFTRDVLDAVEAGLCVDRSRIYATGHSQGGGFVGRLACDGEMSGRIAAFAPVSGAFYDTSVGDQAQCHPLSLNSVCSPSRTDVAMLELHGGDDDTISFHGGFRKGACLPTIRHWAKDWARRDNLDINDAVIKIKGTKNGVKYRYSDGLVTLVYAGDDVGHVWMSKDAGNADIEASEMVMDFFRKYSLKI